MIFDDADPQSKYPFGAVCAGQEVTFRLAFSSCDGAALALWADGQDAQCFPMQRSGDGFEIRHIFDVPGLYFYRFELSDGQIAWRPGGQSFQQTVYSADYVPPRGYAGGLMYQIFPDRFHIGGGIRPPGFDDRVIHADTGEPAVFRPDAAGKVKNNDYYGGNFAGIRQKLPYLTALGVTCIYLNPVCEAHSNHRYDTASYLRPDPLLGTEAEFAALCRAAGKAGIRVILDGVFSHTGADSEYFNKYDRYPGPGAYQSRDSQYYRWYQFEHFPDRYKSWWGFDTLPEIHEEDPGFMEYICGEGGVIDHWMRLGASGFRLDVADELPDHFIERIRAAVKRHGADKILIGEVWEDASNKISYDARRRYLLGSELDSVMNYPFRRTIIDFVRSAGAEDFMAQVMEIVKNYPKPMLDLAMNMLSTHDTVRAINALMASEGEGLDREQQSRVVIEGDDYLRGVEMLKLATVLQFTLPGIPCVYYGDEIGMQGMRDPFNRAFMRWQGVDQNVLSFFQALSAERRAHSAFADGDFVPLCAEDGLIVFLRANAREQVWVALNRANQPKMISLPNGEKTELAPWRYMIKAMKI